MEDRAAVDRVEVSRRGRASPRRLPRSRRRSRARSRAPPPCRAGPRRSRCREASRPSGPRAPGRRPCRSPARARASPERGPPASTKSSARRSARRRPGRAAPEPDLLGVAPRSSSRARSPAQALLVRAPGCVDSRPDGLLHSSFSLRAANALIRSSSQPWRKREMLVSPYVARGSAPPGRRSQVEPRRAEQQVEVAEGIEVAEEGAVGGDALVVLAVERLRAAERVAHLLAEQPREQQGEELVGERGSGSASPCPPSGRRAASR